MKRAASIILFVFLAALLLPAQGGAGMFAPPEGPRAALQPLNSSLHAASAAVSCGYSTPVDDLQKQVSYDSYVDWIEKLSGMEPVSIDGTQYTIETRNSYALFAANNERAKAFEYIHSLLLDWGYPVGQIEEDPYTYNGYSWKNLVLTIPGTAHDRQSVLLTAHLDDAPPYSRPPTADEKAPGADDNATGAAALLEAARVLKDHPLKHTVRIIWFTGEEQYLRGSAAYANDHDLSGVIGVINLDMFGYDAIGEDRCFDIHVGTRPASDFVGRCVQESINAYGINLTTGYINNSSATGSSDHNSFWAHNVGAVEIGENFEFFYELINSCPGDDMTPNYHRSTDTLDRMNPAYAFDITRAALAAFFSLGSMDEYNSYIPALY